MKTSISDISHRHIRETACYKNPSCGKSFPEPVASHIETVSHAISSCWRKNTSSLEAVELANLLRALRKVAGHLGENVGHIEYAGMSTACDYGILIEPEMVMGRYPVPAEKVDYLVGLVVHEAINRIEWSEHVWKGLEAAMEAMTPRAKVIFQKLVRTGEAIYMDMRSEQTVFGFYTPIVREKAFRLECKRFKKDRPSVDGLMLSWQQCAFDPSIMPDMPSDYDSPMGDLMRIAGELKLISLDTAGVIRRCDQRVSLFLRVWKGIEPEITDWKIIDKQLFWFSYSTVTGGEKKREIVPGSGKNKKLPSVLARDIETRLYGDSVDMTPLIRSVAGYENEDVAPMSRWDFQTASHPVVDRKMIGRLRAVFSHYAERNKLMNRGLSSGRVDHRRLYKAAIDGRCFKSMDKIPNFDWSVGLLVDASGSMRGNKWQMVENTIATIHNALSGYRNRLSAWAYFEVSGICMISRLISKNHLFSVPPAGQTASGQAIIAAASMMPANVKRNLLIHITDGESNFGCDVSYGLEYCKQKKIQLITLGCGYKDRQAMDLQYGRSIQFIDYFEQLPAAMETLFKWAFIYGGGSSRFNLVKSGATYNENNRTRP